MASHVERDAQCTAKEQVFETLFLFPVETSALFPLCLRGNFLVEDARAGLAIIQERYRVLLTNRHAIQGLAELILTPPKEPPSASDVGITEVGGV